MKRKRYRLKTIWDNMRQRCSDPNNKYYGAKGIRVCDEWAHSFKLFEEWALSNGYQDSLRIDRKDANGDYAPDNCRWVSVRAQNNNNSHNRIITMDGQEKTLAQWCRVYNIPTYIVDNRVNKYGWEEERAIKTQENATNHTGKVIQYNGQEHNIAEWSRITGISYRVLYNRLVEKGWTPKRAFTEKIRASNHHN